MEPIEYLEFEIEIGQGRDGEYPVTVTLADGQAQGMMRLPFDPHALEGELDALYAALRPIERGRRKKEPAPQHEPHAFGQTLFDALFRGEIRVLYNASRYQAAEEDKLVRLKLGIDPPELAVLPWESLYDAQLAGYVGHAIPLVRYVTGPEISRPATLETPPLRILGMVVHAGDGRPPAVDAERQHLEEALSRLQALELVELEWVEGQSARALAQALDRQEWHVLHLIGDGGLEQTTGEGFVVMDDDAGQSRRLSASQLRWLLSRCKSLQLVWLSACAGATGERPERFATTAALLVQEGTPAVLSAQLGVNSPSAEAFDEAFYAALAASMPLDLAVTKGRMAVHAGGGAPSWGAPVLHTHSPDLSFFERQAVMAAAQQRGDEAMSGDDFERASTQYTLAVEMGAGTSIQEKRDLAEAARQTVRAAEQALDSPADRVEPQIDAVMQSLGDLERLQGQLSSSPLIQSLLERARRQVPGLQERLWLEGEELLEVKTLGLTLDQRHRRMEDSVRLLEKARRLTREENPSLEQSLSKARRRLDYLESAQTRARTGRGRRRLIVGLIIVIIIAAVVALYYALQTLPLSGLFNREPTAIPALTAGATSTLSASLAASPTSSAQAVAGSEATPTAAPTSATPAPSNTATPQPANSATATPTPSAEATATELPTATPLPSDTAAPTPRQASPTNTSTPSPTETPTPGIIYPAPLLVEPDSYTLLSQAGGSDYALRWTLDGTLQPGEWFDVRIWTPGMPHLGIAWTREPVFRFDICELVSGTYFWSIAVVRGEDGAWLGNLSPEAAPRQLSISRSDLWCQQRGF